ncbi:hypothetical protein FQZ97_543150 [compost metagenome]
MEDQYTLRIRENYKRLCANPAVSARLKNPTDAGIKRECAKALLKWNALKDRSIVGDFLSCDYEISILARELKDSEKFKPVVNFLKGKTQRPSEITLAFADWLIEVNLEEIEKRSAEERDQLVMIKEESRKGERREDVRDKSDIFNPTNGVQMQPLLNIAVSSKNKWLMPSKRYRIALILIILLTGGGFYTKKLMSSPEIKIQMPGADEKCMYWNGVQYVPVQCNDTLQSSKVIIPLHIQELVGLQRITRQDTLSLADVNKIWYIKTNNKIECYTAKGRYPLDTNRRLRILSKGIYETYILPKKGFLNLW